MGVRSSTTLATGATYSRDRLREQFGIVDATLNNGIFRPAGHDSVWLFVTEKKTADRTQYVDHLEGDDLYFEGQTTGRTDSLITQHREQGLELLVFHRERKDERPDYSFRYEGPFEYVSSEPGPPTRFHLRRIGKPSIAPKRYWALLCNPDTFDGLGAVQTLDELAWTVDRGNPRPGDLVLLWQAKGSGERGGVIALGEVTRGVITEPGPEAERPFWRVPPAGAQPRIRFKVTRVPGLPLWESEAVPWLSDLAVARARGGTVFSLEPEQWHAVARVEAKDSPPAPDERQGGQGYGLTAAERRAVERHAQSIAEHHFRNLGFEVRDVSRSRCYDLHCTKSGEEVRVEVKGTTGGGVSVFLTRNEVEHARENAARMALVIVSGIGLVRADQPSASGGSMRLMWPWKIDEGTLSAVQFEYQTVMKKEASVVGGL